MQVKNAIFTHHKLKEQLWLLLKSRHSNVSSQLQTVNLVVINDMITVLTVLQFKLLY